MCFLFCFSVASHEFGTILVVRMTNLLCINFDKRNKLTVANPALGQDFLAVRICLSPYS